MGIKGQNGVPDKGTTHREASLPDFSGNPSGVPRRLLCAHRKRGAHRRPFLDPENVERQIKRASPLLPPPRSASERHIRPRPPPIVPVLHPPEPAPDQEEVEELSFRLLLVRRDHHRRTETAQPTPAGSMETTHHPARRTDPGSVPCPSATALLHTIAQTPARRPQREAP